MKWLTTQNTWKSVMNRKKKSAIGGLMTGQGTGRLSRRVLPGSEQGQEVAHMKSKANGIKRHWRDAKKAATWQKQHLKMQDYREAPFSKENSWLTTKPGKGKAGASLLQVSEWVGLTTPWVWTSGLQFSEIINVHCSMKLPPQNVLS